MTLTLPYKNISIVTSARSDFGLLLPLMEAVDTHPLFELSVLATGIHFLEEFGHTIDEVNKSSICSRVINLPTGVNPETAAETARAIGQGTNVFAKYFSASSPDLLVILGDRFDALPAAIAALPFRIPIAHISGGEITEGAIDDYVRHVLSKLSHIHFAATEEYAQRIIQLGEEPHRVHNVGEPGLDVIKQMKFLDRIAFFERVELTVDAKTSLFTYHPETSNPADNRSNINNILDVAENIAGQILFTYPNGDPGSTEIITALENFCSKHTSAKVVPSLGRELYLNALEHSDCVVGNSSSGIVETASFGIPTVNIGSRQKGRIQPATVIDSDCDPKNIKLAWDKALSDSFRNLVTKMINPYGDGHAVKRIISVFEENLTSGELWQKQFHTIASDKGQTPVMQRRQV